MKYFLPVFAALFLMGCSGCARRAVPAASVPPAGISNVYSIDVPGSVQFAGEVVDLTRYDKRERYDREINGFAYLHSTTMLLIKRANRYFPVIEPILKENGVPDDLKYLCVIESNLDQRAVSSAGAAGLWQFLKSTGPNYGLEINDEVDERYSVVRSTEAACKYLKEAYAKYGSWAGAALSYNAGQRRISDQLTKQQAEEALDLLLVEETSRYYYRMLAIKQVMENPAAYGFRIKADQLYKPMKYKEVKVRKSISDMSTYARENGLTYAQLKDFNAWLRSDKLTIPEKGGKTYTLWIPSKDFLHYKDGEAIYIHNPAWVAGGSEK